MQEKKISLYYNDLATGGSSDKIYIVTLEARGAEGFLVGFEFGRRGGTLVQNYKTPEPVPYDVAEKKFNALVADKMKNGYKPGKDVESQVAAPPAVDPGERTEMPAELLEPITAAEAKAYNSDSRYVMQLKYDGYRCQVSRLRDETIIAFNKLGGLRPLPAEVHRTFKALHISEYLFDGELVGSRYVIYDVLRIRGLDVSDKPYHERIGIAVKYIPMDEKVAQFLKVAPTFYTSVSKATKFKNFRDSGYEGVVYKMKDAPYRAGRNGQQKKCKFWKSATCRVMSMGDRGHNNVTVALKHDGSWLVVGSANMNGKDKRIQVGSLVEIKFLYATAGNRLYQPEVKMLRDDVKESECTLKQLDGCYKVEAA